MGGSWIFLSHSSKDIALIRKIRNEFEDCGHNPLAFHLKCLNSETPEGRDEIFALLKREIDARNWFIFCNSVNSRNSEYVSYERDYILTTGKKQIWELDLAQDWEQIKKTIHRISKDLKIYVSFDSRDKAYADILIKQLRDNDFTVWTDEDTKGETIDAVEHFGKDIYTQCIIYGLYFIFISNNSLCHVDEEISYILNCCNGGETIVPIFIGKPDMPPEDERWFRSGNKYFDISDNIETVDYSQIFQFLEACLQDSRRHRY